MHRLPCNMPPLSGRIIARALWVLLFTYKRSNDHLSKIQFPAEWHLLKLLFVNVHVNRARERLPDNLALAQGLKRASPHVLMLSCYIWTRA